MRLKDTVALLIRRVTTVHLYERPEKFKDSSKSDKEDLLGRLLDPVVMGGNTRAMQVTTLQNKPRVSRINNNYCLNAPVCAR